jgi:hypothetical protein
VKKRFQLQVENKNPDRLLEAIKHEIRKYIKREKRKPIPEGVDYWRLECRFAKEGEELHDIKFENLIRHIDEAAAEGCEGFEVEIYSTKGLKNNKDSEADLY